ncbi:MAG: zinc-ribbon domain-containing protein [Dissulfurispiraceae bacterium]|jgi:hypothetical protein
MKFCPVCGKEITQLSKYCPHCGFSLESFTNQSKSDSPSQREVSDLDFTAFIGNNFAYYVHRFKKFNLGGTDVFALTWNWAAFWGGFGWMLYRKMYMWATIAFVLTLIPHLGLIAWIAVGAVANYLYYQHAKSKILEIKTMHPTVDISGYLSQVGGINKWVPIAAIIITILLFLSFIVMVFVLAIPFSIFNIFSPQSQYI